MSMSCKKYNKQVKGKLRLNLLSFDLASQARAMVLHRLILTGGEANEKEVTYKYFLLANSSSLGVILNGICSMFHFTVTLSPQNMMIIGGGPAGLIMAIHCAENVLLSGGIVKLFEARNSLFERSQIVRLDARWIAMMRYHLGTGFEDGKS